MKDNSREDFRPLSYATFLQDAAGVISLVVLLVVGLNLPAVL